MRKQIATLDRIVGELEQVNKELERHYKLGLAARTPLLSAHGTLRNYARDLEKEAKK